MFLLILFAMNSLFGSCTAPGNKAAAKAEVKVEAITDKGSTSNPAETVVATKEEVVAPAKKIKKLNKEQNAAVNPSSESIQITTAKPKIVTIKKEPEVVKSEPIKTSAIESPKPKETIKEDPGMESPVTKTPKVQPVVGHADFNALLQKHVKNGLVNYTGFKADAAKFDAYLSYLSSNAPSTSDKSKSALAYWMNAYNAFTIKLIVNNLPVKSIMDLDGGKPWDKKWIEIGGNSYSLNNIEHEIIRPVFNEPRIHFAIVCAAKSCPPIDNQAFTASNVDANLERLTKSFINNPNFNTITESKVTITPIMDWYGKDFGNVLGFVQKYANTTVADNAKVKFTEYDWSLNGQ